MFEERLMATAERCGALIVGIAGVAAGYLFLVSLSGWNPENRGFFSLLPIPGWLHGFLIVSATAAFVVCIATMLFAVTIETRRINAIRESLERRRRRRLQSQPLRDDGDKANEPQGVSIQAHSLPPANQERREAERVETALQARAGLERGN